MKQPTRHDQRRRKQRSQEGAVMMIVLLILLTATAMASASLQTTQYEVRAAGYGKNAIQMQYVSEAAAVTTFSWVDTTVLDGSFANHLGTFTKTAPLMAPFGEPEVPTANLSYANRTQWRQQAFLTAIGMPPISQPGVPATDPLGTFGPRTPYFVGAEDKNNPNTTDYVVDMYDCRKLPNTVAPGSQVNYAGSSQAKEQQLYCAITSRGRAYVGGAPHKIWKTKAGDYDVNRFTLAHDSRGTFVTPPFLVNF
jgi:hypothetical protein